MENYSERYNYYGVPSLIRSDFMVTPLVQTLAVEEIKSWENKEDSVVADIGAGIGVLSNHLAQSFPKLIIHHVEPSCTSVLVAGMINRSLDYERLQRELEHFRASGNENVYLFQPSRFLTLDTTAVEYLETLPRNLVSLFILSMVTLHFCGEELLEVVHLLSQKITVGGSVIIADLHSSRFLDTKKGKLVEVTLPTTNPKEKFSLQYHPRRFEDISSAMINSGFQSERIIIPQLHSIVATDFTGKSKIIQRELDLPEILGQLAPDEEPYQIEVFRKR
jgi:Methyltransferase small domain